MRPQEIIAKKRDGGELTTEEIGSFIDGVCDHSWTDYQISALLMAMFIRGLGQTEQNELTRTMIYSGKVLDLSDVGRPVVDKHSTGGVGDKTSLIIAPIAAACGLAVPMISGRGLGHTGGTLDKLESIPGFDINLPTETFKELLRKNGYAMAGQTGEIAPADKKLYALRDATATVPCIPLIVASIMSKKLAEDLDALVLDVKTGSGAFMQSFGDAVKLADALVKTGNDFGVKTQAVVSGMDQPLGKFVGNALEVYECIMIFRGETEPEMHATLDLSIELTARMLVLGGISDTLEYAKLKIGEVVDSGAALEKFRENVIVQGGDARVCDDPASLIDKTMILVPIPADRDGFVTAIDTLAVGNAMCGIGGGRNNAEDEIDHAIGFASERFIGDEVRAGETLAVLYCRDKENANSTLAKLSRAYTISAEYNQIQSQLIKEVIG